jgi:hypothetical protein
MGVTKTDNGTFLPIRSGTTCPVSGSKKGRCSEFYDNNDILIFYRCKYQESSIENKGWFIHYVQDVTGVSPKEKPIRLLPDVNVGEEMTEERLEITNSVYKFFRELVKKYEGSYLNARDMKDLLDRNLSTEDIERMELFSMPTCVINSQKELDEFMTRKTDKLFVKEKQYNGKQIRIMVRNYNDGKKAFNCQLITALSKDLERKFGASLLKVSGFIKRSDQFKNDYITFYDKRYNPLYDVVGELLACSNSEKTDMFILQHFWKVQKYVPIKGYFIPYKDFKGTIQALQYRLTTPQYDEKGKAMRYFWYSSKNARSGSPIDVYKPKNFYVDKTNNLRDDVIMITEGALKGKIASEKFGFTTCSEAGVSNYNILVRTIIDLSKKMSEKPKIIMALDMDKYDNEEVLNAEEKTINLLIQAGFQVAIASWNMFKAKGIDDALDLNLKISFTKVN